MLFPLLNLAGFYQPQFEIETKTSVKILEYKTDSEESQETI
jgi:hypothetical protein